MPFPCVMNNDILHRLDCVQDSNLCFSKGVQGILRKAGRKMPRHILSTVRFGAGLATCHSRVRPGSMVRQL